MVWASARYIEAGVVKNVSSDVAIEVLDTIFPRNDLQSILISYNSKSFTSEVFQNTFVHPLSISVQMDKLNEASGYKNSNQ